MSLHTQKIIFEHSRDSISGPERWSLRVCVWILIHRSRFESHYSHSLSPFSSVSPQHLTSDYMISLFPKTSIYHFDLPYTNKTTMMCEKWAKQKFWVRNSNLKLGLIVEMSRVRRISKYPRAICATLQSASSGKRGACIWDQRFESSRWRVLTFRTLFAN